jgi:hypothetical protein
MVWLAAIRYGRDRTNAVSLATSFRTWLLGME